jgi:hypothetical protein
MCGFEGGYDPKREDQVSFRHTVGSARRDPDLINREGKGLERVIQEAQLPVAEFVNWTFEYANPKEQMMAPYHRLLREELEGWLEQKVQEGKALPYGSEQDFYAEFLSRSSTIGDKQAA